jgi:hypothetical protein
MRCSYALGLALSVHGEASLSSLKEILITRLYLNMGKKVISKVTTDEQGGSNNIPRFG